MYVCMYIYVCIYMYAWMHVLRMHACIASNVSIVIITKAVSHWLIAVVDE